MISPLDSAISAISAFSVKMNVIANNIANLNSDGFKKGRTALKEGPFGGLEPDVDQVNTSSHTQPIAENGGWRQVDASNVDLAEEFTDSLSTQSGYKANLKIMQAYDEMLGSLLDTIG
jgi:flagellar hook protein FlgE